MLEYFKRMIDDAFKFGGGSPSIKILHLLDDKFSSAILVSFANDKKNYYEDPELSYNFDDFKHFIESNGVKIIENNFDVSYDIYDFNAFVRKSIEDDYSNLYKLKIEATEAIDKLKRECSFVIDDIEFDFTNMKLEVSHGFEFI